MGQNEKKDIISEEELDQMLFQRIQVLIDEERLFLTPRLTRDYVISKTNVPKNKFASLFIKFTGVSFTDYINNLRLDYAAEQLVEHPEYKVETIAVECGIPKSQTFYRLFSKRFGLTPTEYRNRQKK